MLVVNFTYLSIITALIAVAFIIVLIYLKSEARKKRYLAEEEVISQEEYVRYLSKTNKIKLIMVCILIILSYFIFKNK